MNRVQRLKAKHKIGLIFFPAFDWEINPTHPERKERLLYTRDQIFEEGLMDIAGIEEYNPDIASLEDVQRANICVPAVENVSTESHLISAGAAIKAAELVLEDKVDKAFAIVRPPGHHAHRVVHGARGFCNTNNEAVMVEAIRKKHPDLKIAFVDTDAHHADGTQEIYYHDPNVLHISLHQDGRTLYPGSGFINELGGPGAFARTLNIPLLPGTSDEGLIYVVKEFVLPVLAGFKPDLLINSAGQDNHYSDPLTNMCISAQGYAEMNALLDPDLAILQGGYSIESALPYVNVGLILAMAGLDYSRLVEPDYIPEKLRQDKEITRDIKQKVAKLQEFWETRDQIDLEQVYGKLDKFYARDKNIYYDTDGISEKQKEQLRFCEDCSGYLLIDSSASRSYFNKNRIFAVSIPRLVCENCHQEARQEFEKIKKEARGKYDYIYLQDLKADQYLVEALS
ncbi:MAG: histone deacetylase [Firmicutes bacterium]|nr:histone deacetylase [Bacillota bacterium]